MPTSQTPRIALLFAPVLALGMIVAVLNPLPLSPIPVEIRARGIEGGVALLLPGTTFGEAVSQLELRAEAGDLIDVQGEVLEPGTEPGQILLEGRESPPSTPLEPGHRIDVVEGEDRREALHQEIVLVEGRRPGNPQFFLATTPGRQIITTGRISGKLVFTAFVPEGENPLPPTVALTFDDGPSPTWTPRILEVLETYSVPATFFVVGYLAERYSYLIEREVAAGMAVASHSWGHPLSPPFRELPTPRLKMEIKKPRRFLRSIGVAVSLFRPPQGSYSDQVVRIADRRKMRVVMWNVDPGDWRDGVTSEQVIEGVLSAVRPGSIVVLHDGGGDRSATVEALPAIIDGIRARGFDLVAIGPRGRALGP
jgi:peptidoglycan/xylan/chitin deacetylase (PgdA/CDA1 family)